MDDLNMKNGIPFEAETEYLYQKKIEELRDRVINLKSVLLMCKDQMSELSRLVTFLEKELDK